MLPAPPKSESAKKKLLVVTSTFPRWEDDPKPSFVWELSRRLTGAFDVSVLAPHFPGAERQEVIDGIRIYRFKYFIAKYQTLTDMGGIMSALNRNKFLYLQLPFLIIAELFALLKCVRIIQPDLVHAHWIIPQGFLAYLNFKILHTPYIITSHGSDIFGIRGLNFIKRISLKHSKRITAVSREIKCKIIKEIDPSLTVDIIPMGVDTDIFSPSMKDASLLQNHDIKGPFLLFVGRLSPEKGLKTLIDALPEVISEFSNTKLLIIGDGNLKRELAERVRQKNLQRHVCFAGKLPNRELPRYYATADVFVCPSLREGSPVTFIESLACGTSIIVGDLPVSREITFNNNGLLVKQNNAKDIAQKIIGLLKTKRKSEKELHAFVRDNYDWKVIADRFIRLLKA